MLIYDPTNFINTYCSSRTLVIKLAILENGHKNRRFDLRIRKNPQTRPMLVKCPCYRLMIDGEKACSHLLL